MAIDQTIIGLPEDLEIDGSELIETIARDGRKAVPLNKLPVSTDSVFTAVSKVRPSIPAEAMAADPAETINTRLNYLSLSGGGNISLPPGMIEPKSQILAFSKTGFEANGKGASNFRRHSSWTTGEAMFDFHGLPFGSNPEHKTEMALWGITILGNGLPGLGINGDNTSALNLRNIGMSGFSGCAISLMENWDSVIDTVSVRNSGGVLGAADAMMRITGSPVDKANMTRCRGLHFETFPNCALYVGDDGYGSNRAPFGILFENGFKAESGILVSNATPVKISDAAAPGVFFHTEMNVHASSPAGAPSTGVRLVDGALRIAELRYNIAGNIAVTSIVRLGANSLGGHIGRVIGSSQVDPTCMLEVNNTRDDGAAYQYNPGAMTVDYVLPRGSVPMIGGSGALGKTVRLRQLRDTPLAATITGPRGCNPQDVGRILPVLTTSSAQNWSYTIYSDIAAAPGERMTLWVQGPGTAGFVANSGVTIRVPAGKSLSATGPDSLVQLLCTSTNNFIVL